MSVASIMEEVLKDKSFYETSGGGMTLSGGEPMFQFDFTLALMMAAKSEGIHVCMETCGFAPLERYEEALPYIDIFLFDIKESDPVRHLAFTGAPLEPVRRGLALLDSKGAKIVLRCPIIPGLNDRTEHFTAIGKLATELRHVIQVDLEPYHPLGISKNERIGKKSPLANMTGFPEGAEKGRWLESIQSATGKPVFLS